MPTVTNETEFWQACIEYLHWIATCAQAILYSTTMSAAAGLFLIVLYSVRNRNIWGAVLLGVSFGGSPLYAQYPGLWHCVSSVNPGYAVGWNEVQSVSISQTGNGFVLHVELYHTNYPEDAPSLVVHEIWDCTAQNILPGSYVINSLGESNPITQPSPFRWCIEAIEGTSACGACDPLPDPVPSGNCCGDGSWGATYFVGEDSYGCPYVGCNSEDCQTCPPIGDGEIGDSCPCADGESGGTLAAGEDSNGCPTLECSGCEPECPEFDPEEVGSECECREGGSGTVAVEENDQGCPIPVCECDEGEDGSCRNAGGDADGDGCCDDWDPNPGDENSSCDDCSSQLEQKVSEVMAQVNAWLPLPSGSISQSGMWFSVGTPEANFRVAHKFAFSASIDLNSLTTNFDSSVAGPWIAEFRHWRDSWMDLSAAVIWFFWAIQVITVLRRPW